MKKKVLAALLTSALLVTFAGCGQNNNSSAGQTTTTAGGQSTEAGNTNTDNSANTNTDNSANTNVDASTQEINVCLASEPATLDPALNSSVDGATLCAHLFSGLAKWDQNDAGVLEIVPDLAESLPEGVENADGTVTYTYTLRDGAKWSDGKDVTANDFVFSWNRSASPELAADYCYMLEIVKGYNEMWEEDDSGNLKNPDAKLAVVAKDDKTLEVTLNNAVSYWNELLAFPSYYPVREDVVSNDSWATDPSTYVSNGAYKMTSWDHNSVITLTKNDNYIDAGKVTMGTINFYLSDDANNMLTNFKNGSWQLIDDVPTNEMAALQAEYPDEYTVTGQLGTYYVCWNINYDLLPSTSSLEGADRAAANAEIRNALSLLIDRNYIVESIAQGGQVPASSFVAMGLTDADGSQFYKNAGSDSAFDGYYNVSEDAYTDNWNKAIEILKKYYTYDESTGTFSDIPSMVYLYNTSEGHKAIAENIQGVFSTIGVNMKLENQEWATFLETRKSGDYTVARNGWLADFNDPISFLDMWTTSSGNNDVQYGKGDNASVAAYSIKSDEYGVELSGTWAETYDELISRIKATTDTKTRYGLMHLAEDLLMETGCLTPIYYYTDIYMLDSGVKGFFSNPLGYKYFMYCTVG